jgi:hypothetical protein
VTRFGSGQDRRRLEATERAARRRRAAIADSVALRSSQEPSAELPRPTERDPEGSTARAWQPRGVSLRLLAGTVTRAPEEGHGQADLRGECVP